MSAPEPAPDRWGWLKAIGAFLVPLVSAVIGGIVRRKSEDAPPAAPRTVPDPFQEADEAVDEELRESEPPTVRPAAPAGSNPPPARGQ